MVVHVQQKCVDDRIAVGIASAVAALVQGIASHRRRPPRPTPLISIPVSELIPLGICAMAASVERDPGTWDVKAQDPPSFSATQVWLS